MLSWLKSNPVMGLIGLLLAALGFGGLRMRFLSNKVAANEAATKKAETEFKAREISEQAVKFKGKKQKLKAILKEVRAQEADSIKTAEDAKKERDRIAGKYRAVVPCFLLLLTGATGLWAQGPACEPNTDLGGLTQALRASSETPVVADTIAVIQGFQRERTALCQRIDSLRRQVAILEQELVVTEGLAGAHMEMSELYRQSWEDASARRFRTSRSLFGITVGGGLCVDGDGRALACGAIVWGLRF